MFFFRLFSSSKYLIKKSGSPGSLKRKGEFISPTGLLWGKSLTFCTCKRSCARANDGKIVRIKRPSHGKLKFANSCWQTSKTWQTRALTRQTRVKSQHAKFANLRNMADAVQWHSRRAAACVLVLLYVNRQRRNRKRWNIIKVWTKRYISRNLTLVTFNTLVQELLLQTIRPTNLDNCDLRKWIEKLHVRLYVRPSFCEVSRKSREQSAWFDWLTVTNTRLQTFQTWNTSLPTQKKLVKKLARIETSSICRQ